jgi:exosortase
MRDPWVQTAYHEQNKDILHQSCNNIVETAETTVLSKFDAAVTKRCFLFVSWIVFSSLLFSFPLIAFVRMSLANDDTSYLPLIPFISVWLLFVKSHKIFQHLSYDVLWGCGLLFLAGCVACASRLAAGRSSLDLQLSGSILSLGLVWVAGFLLLFGRAAAKAGDFPLLFLFLMVPLPNFVLDQVIHLLQAGSAWITGAFFDLFGVPALREGLVFHLARFNIEVAKECSGIRSSMALLILALLVAHFRLKRFWIKTLFVASGLLMMIVKNGIRIATLTVLAVYVDPSFLTGRLHHEGGVLFFVLALLLLLPVLTLLQRWESRRPGDTEPLIPS